MIIGNRGRWVAVGDSRETFSLRGLAQKALLSQGKRFRNRTIPVHLNSRNPEISIWTEAPWLAGPIPDFGFSGALHKQDSLCKAVFGIRAAGIVQSRNLRLPR